MSNDAVREAFRQALTSTFPGVPYVESITTRVDNAGLPDLWQSLQFIAASDDAVTIGKPAWWRELGIARVWVVGKAGTGDAAAVQQADMVNNALRRFTALNEGLKVMSTSPPQNAAESDGRWFLVSVDLRYQYDRFI